MEQKSIEQMAGHQVNARADELMEEFFQHYEEFVQTHPDMTDKHIVFEGWVVQKIAGLQLVVLELAQRLDTFIKSQATDEGNSG
jgi:hypothetical protein